MGNTNALELQADQDSPTNPGCLSVVSASLDEVDPPMSADAFIDGLLELMRYPVDALAERVLKSVEVTDHGPDSFTVKVLLDGKALSSWGYGREDNCDRVRTWKKVTVDRAQKLVITEDYVMEAAPVFGEWADKAEDKEAVNACHVKMLAEPTRIESWLLQGGQRVSSQDLASGLQEWVNRIVSSYQSVANAKVKVAIGPSKKEPGQKSVLSQAIDDHVYYETYFSTMVKMTKEELSKPPGAVVDDVNDSEFVISIPEPETDKIKTKWVVKHSEATGDMSICVQNEEGQVMDQFFRHLHKDPVVLESWSAGQDGARREPSSRFVLQIQKEVNNTIDKATSWF